MEQLPGQAMQIVLTILLGIIGAVIFLKKNKSKHLPNHELHLLELIMREQEKNKRLSQRVEVLEEELAHLKNQLNELAEHTQHQSHHQPDTFQYTLQRQSFLQKNSEIVLMLQGGLSIERAAKASNKSVREAEMIDAVLRRG